MSGCEGTSAGNCFAILLSLHLRTAHPSSSAARGQLTAAPASMFAASIAPSAAVKLADSRVRGGGMSGMPLHLRTLTGSCRAARAQGHAQQSIEPCSCCAPQHCSCWNESSTRAVSRRDMEVGNGRIMFSAVGCTTSDRCTVLTHSRTQHQAQATTRTGYTRP